MSHGFKYPLPDHVTKLIEKSQRDALGLKTLDEKLAEAEVKSERDLSNQVENLLRLRGIVYFKSRSDRKTTRPKGEPDFLLSVMVTEIDKENRATYSWPLACAWELKIGGRALSDEQQAMFRKLTTPPNAWACRVIRSIDDALTELRRLGL